MYRKVFSIMKRLLLTIPVLIAVMAVFSINSCYLESGYPYSAFTEAEVMPKAQAAKEFSPENISERGKNLGMFLDKLNVETLWVPGKDIDWKTGEVKSDRDSSTHCSAFAAAVAYKLNIYLLRPPEHSQLLLANAQQDWLKLNGTKNGWREVSDFPTAQTLANNGFLVLASYKSPSINKPGHIAIVRPYSKSIPKLEEEGPQIIQAGSRNYNSTSLKTGFKNHPNAWEDRQILLYSHDADEIPSSSFN